MYLLKPVGLVTTFSHSSRHMNVPCYKFETIELATEKEKKLINQIIPA